jgi:hypothetical protein
MVQLQRHKKQKENIMAKSGNEKVMKYVIARVKFLLRFGIDLDLVITETKNAAGKVEKEVITGKTKRDGTFEITWATGAANVKVDGQDYNFDWTNAKEFRKVTKLKELCHRWRDKHYYLDKDGKYVKNPKRAGFFGRLFAVKAK